MKRVAAFIIDYLIMTVIITVLGLIFFMNINNMLLRWIVVFACMYMFYWLNDVIFCGSSPGKKAMKMNIVIKSNSLLLFATVHALFKMFFSFIWIISLLICLVGKGRMPYDKYLYDKSE